MSLCDKESVIPTFYIICYGVFCGTRLAKPIVNFGIDRPRKIRYLRRILRLSNLLRSASASSTLTALLRSQSKKSFGVTMAFKSAIKHTR